MSSYDAAPIDGIPEPYGLLLAILQDGTREWMGELGDLEAIPAEAMTFAARPGGPTMGAQMLHLTAVEHGWLARAPLGMELTEEDAKILMRDEIDVDKGIWPTPPSEPFSWYLNLYQERRRQTLELAPRWPEAGHVFARSWGSLTMGWIVGHMIQHDSYHGGQIVLLHEHWLAARA
jgi:uncharacterized damage-inducible protein DinB